MPIWTNLLHPICQLTMIAVRYLCERTCISEHVCLCLCHYDSFLCMHMFVLCCPSLLQVLQNPLDAVQCDRGQIYCDDRA